MSLAVGKVEYTIENTHTQVLGYGISYTVNELDSALAGAVAAIVFDEQGKTNILTSLLDELSDTEFDRTGIERILNDTEEPENWRVGEGIAEAYLIHHRGCIFPWPDSRDERKSGSSLPGADLVGFQQDDETYCFAFGETKTSSEANYPPSVMHGRTGLKQQLEDLRDKSYIRDDLMKYLAYRAVLNVSWKKEFIEASKRYIADSTDVKLFGVLVRDVLPHKDDLETRVTKLCNGCPSRMSIELLALYLPTDSISTFSKKIISSRKKEGV